MKYERLRRGFSRAAIFILSALVAGTVPVTAQPSGSYPAMACAQAEHSIVLKKGGVTAAPPEPGCVPVEIPVPPESVRWAAWIPSDGTDEAERVTLEGAERHDRFEPTLARVERRDTLPPRPPALLVGQSLIEGITARPFGVEERVEVSRGDRRVTLTCREGSQPAGIILDPGAVRIPQGASLAIRVSAENGSGFRAGLVPAGSSAEALWPLPAQGTTDLAVPQTRELRDSPWLIVACPAGGGSMAISDLKLVPHLSDPERPIPKAAWAWKPDLWRDRPDVLLQRARSSGLSRLFISVEIEDGQLKGATALAAFVERARDLGIATAIVEGDPGMALQPGRTAAVSRLSAIQAYQQNAAPKARLAGVQYDIEPYLLPAFATDPAGVLEGWATTIRALRQATDLELDLVLPFWLTGQDLASKSVLPAIKEAADRITVMAYRTTLDDLQAAAEPFLSWGATEGVPVHIALESGPIADEQHRVYQRSARGELLIHPQGTRALVLLLDGPVEHAAPLAFMLSRTINIRGSIVSFLGESQRMIELADQAAGIFRAWPSFGGLAFHGLLE